MSAKRRETVTRVKYLGDRVKRGARGKEASAASREESEGRVGTKERNELANRPESPSPPSPHALTASLRSVAQHLPQLDINPLMTFILLLDILKLERETLGLPHLSRRR